MEREAQASKSGAIVARVISRNKTSLTNNYLLGQKIPLRSYGKSSKTHARRGKDPRFSQTKKSLWK